MELLLLLLLPVAVLGAFSSGGHDDGGGDDEVVRSGNAEGESLEGGRGDDLIFGASGQDTMVGQAGNDMLFGEGFEDTLRGLTGNDILFGGNANDVLEGGADDDLLFGGADRDVLYGGVGDDILIGGSDIDTLYGGDGNDTLSGVEITPATAEADLAEVGANLNTLVEVRHGAAVADRFADRIARSVVSANDEGATEADDFAPPPRPDLLEGGDLNDVLIGDHGDLMTGGAGFDQFVAVYNTGSAPVDIRDFEDFETIVLDVGADARDVAVDVDGRDGVILLGDEVVAIVRGFTDAAVLANAVAVSRAAA